MTAFGEAGHEEQEWTPCPTSRRTTLATHTAAAGAGVVRREIDHAIHSCCHRAPPHNNASKNNAAWPLVARAWPASLVSCSVRAGFNERVRHEPNKHRAEQSTAVWEQRRLRRRRGAPWRGGRAVATEARALLDIAEGVAEATRPTCLAAPAALDARTPGCIGIKGGYGASGLGVWPTSSVAMARMPPTPVATAVPPALGWTPPRSMLAVCVHFDYQARGETGASPPTVQKDVP